MLGKVPEIDRSIYEVVEYSKKHTNKDRYGFLCHLADVYGFNPSRKTIDRWLSNIETNFHLPAFALAAFVNYYSNPDNNDPKAPSSLTPLVHIAQEAGYMLFPIEKTNPKDNLPEFFQAVIRNQRESADVIAACADAMEDKELEKVELERIQRELLEQIGASSVLLDMVFEALRG